MRCRDRAHFHVFLVVRRVHLIHRMKCFGKLVKKIVKNVFCSSEGVKYIIQFFYENAHNEIKRIRRPCRMKLFISEEYGKCSVVGWRSSSPNTLSEIKRLRRKRQVKISVLGEYGE